MGTRRDYRIPVDVGATSGFAWGGAALITQKDFVRALKLCWPVLAEPRRRMLATHCNAPAQTITMTQLAKVAGYSDYTSANLHYGSTARVLILESVQDAPYAPDSVGALYERTGLFGQCRVRQAIRR